MDQTRQNRCVSVVKQEPRKETDQLNQLPAITGARTQIRLY